MVDSVPQSEDPLSDVAIDRAVLAAKKLYYVRMAPVRNRHLGITTIKEDLKALGILLDCFAITLKQSHDIAALPAKWNEFQALFPEESKHLLDHIVDEVSHKPKMTGQIAEQEKEAYYAIAREILLRSLGTFSTKGPDQSDQSQPTRSPSP